MLYRYKNFNFSFVVLCPNCNIGHIKNTIGSIKNHYHGTKITAVLPDSCDKDTFLETSKNCETIKGGTTTAEMINSGMGDTGKEWVFIIITRGLIKNKIDIKYSYFIESEKDIIFSILSRKMNFIDADINGMLVHKNSFLDIGEFPNINSLEKSKTIWASNALEKGYKFKGVVGAKFF